MTQTNIPAVSDVKAMVERMCDAARDLTGNACRTMLDAAGMLLSLSADRDEARRWLAGTDIGSLPNDWTLAQIAEARWDDISKLRDQVRDTCRRAEAAEARVAELERGGWRPIETAPRDGRWLLAYRPPPSVGMWNTLVTIKWWAAVGDFIWGDRFQICDPYDDHDTRWIENGDFYQASNTFTHWMPLPVPPRKGE